MLYIVATVLLKQCAWHKVTASVLQKKCAHFGPKSGHNRHAQSYFEACNLIIQGISHGLGVPVTDSIPVIYSRCDTDLYRFDPDNSLKKGCKYTAKSKDRGGFAYKKGYENR